MIRNQLVDSLQKRAEAGWKDGWIEMDGWIRMDGSGWIRITPSPGHSLHRSQDAHQSGAPTSLRRVPLYTRHTGSLSSSMKDFKFFLSSDHVYPFTVRDSTVRSTFWGVSCNTDSAQCYFRTTYQRLAIKVIIVYGVRFTAKVLTLSVQRVSCRLNRLRIEVYSVGFGDKWLNSGFRAQP